MATTAPATPESLSPARADLLAAFERARKERLVCYPTATPGVWECKGYQVVETGPEPHQVRCDCADCTFRERICKHGAVVVFCRKYGLRPIRPSASVLALPTPIRRCANCGTDPAAHGSANCAGCDHVLAAEAAIAADRRHEARDRQALEDAAYYGRPIHAAGHGWN